MREREEKSSYDASCASSSWPKRKKRRSKNETQLQTLYCRVELPPLLDPGAAYKFRSPFGLLLSSLPSSCPLPPKTADALLLLPAGGGWYVYWFTDVLFDIRSGVIGISDVTPNPPPNPPASTNRFASAYTAL